MNSKKNLKLFLGLSLLFFFSAIAVGVLMIYWWNALTAVEKAFFPMTYAISVLIVGGVIAFVWKYRIFQK